MAHGRSLPAVGSQATVPRKYMRAVRRGMWNLWRHHPGTYAPRGQHHMLDEALRYAAAFQERSARRWAEAALGPAQSYRIREPCVGEKGDAGSGPFPTLQHLASLDEEKEEEQIFPTFFEKQQARLHVALQQWVFYSGFRCSQAEFMVRQSKVSKTLLLSPMRVIPSSRSNTEGARCLEASVRRRGARAYVDLLVKHKLFMQKEEEWTTLCELCGHIGKRQQIKMDEGGSFQVMALPFLRSSNPHASWERSLAVLSWAMQFRNHKQQSTHHQQYCQHISSMDISDVLQQYAQHFEERTQVPLLTHDDDSQGNLVLGNAAEQDVVARLQQWWVAAREAEKQNPRLAEICGLDRTLRDRIHVEGRKVTLTSSNETSAGVDTVFPELLFQGRWEDVLHHIERIAADSLRLYGPAAEQQQDGEEECEDKGSIGQDVAGVFDEMHEERRVAIGDVAPSPSIATENVLAMFFNRPRPILIKGKLWVHTTASRLGRIPRALLTADETPAEKELLYRPPTAGLRSRRLTIDERNRKEQTRCTEKSPSPALLELRRKMWIHFQLPKHVAHSLVRFEGVGASMLPYLYRSPAKELAPWLLVATIAAIAQRQEFEGIHEALHRVRMQTLYTLFSPVPYYAAFQEYCAEIIIQLGNLLAPPKVLRVAVRSIFCPPSFRHFYDILKGRRIPMETACRKFWWGSLEDALDAESKKVTCSSFFQSAVSKWEQVRGDLDTMKEFFMCKAASLRNYHVSTWIEGCSKVETLAGLLDILVQEINVYGPPLLSPEAATALLTAVLILHSTEGGENKVSASTDTLRSLGVVYFVVPADRVFSAAPYFKGIYHERYISSTSLDWTVGWDGAEALLVGRSIRRITKYPTTTKEAFFRVEHRQLGSHDENYFPKVTFRVPEIRLRVMAVHLLDAARYFEDQGQQLQKDEKRTTTVSSQVKGMMPDSKPEIVARHLPFGAIAVNKPAGMSTTLHVAYPHLIQYLARCVPWKGVDIPVLFQHGLVNRIDVGTSGLVLVTDTGNSLVATRRASVVDRRVEKIYRALVLHCPPPESRAGSEEFWYLNPKGVINWNVFANGADYSLQLAAHDPERKRGLPPAFMDRRPATTMYRVLNYYPSSGVYYLEVQLRSGRRHQIRQHFAQICHPLVGDGRYHERARSMGEQMGLYRPALHASRITLLPSSLDSATDAIDDVSYTRKEDSEKTVVECPLPDDIRRALRWLQEKEERGKSTDHV
ncbi:RNA pseudouridylate synthase, putative [Trypanosoma cruzi]|nr:RNA pseudouridylate synthase, putative [Trypanosoma cruzi]